MSDDNIVKFSGISKLDLNPNIVLKEAIKMNLKRVVILGYVDDAETDEYFASSIADGADVVWLLERMKLELLRLPDGE